MKKVNKGDIVLVSKKKYPELAFFYYEIKDIQEDSKDILVQLRLPKMKTGSKKSKKKARKIKEFLDQNFISHKDVIVVLKNPRYKKSDV